MSRAQSNPRSQFGERLKQAREARGLSQADVCRAAGITANAYNQWEKGRRLINVFDAMKLADGLGISLDWIYRGDEEGKAMQEERNDTDGQEWTETTSELFADYGEYFVPERDIQMETVCALIPDIPDAPHVVEICCGEGLLSETILARLPGVMVHAYDGSPTMLAKTRGRLTGYEGRFETREMQIEDADWRQCPWPVRAFVSSLAVHHLDGPGKLALFSDLTAALAPGGAVIIVDLVEPETTMGQAVSAKAWDDAVRNRSLELDGDLAAFEFFRDDQWNYYSDPNPDPVDQPSSLLDQLKWMQAAGLEHVDVHWLKAGHAIFSGRKPIS
ncbi:MAG: helix-turn-helix domain-containing protein [Alphaproteobacteria bacterium]